jgi:mRNA interferase MazF
VDFGITQKVRPALVISIPYGGADRALIGVIPHTTATRGSQFEVSVPTRFLGEGAFLGQGIQALPPKYFLRRLGILTPDQLRQVEKGCCVGRAFRPNKMEVPQPKPASPFTSFFFIHTKGLATPAPLCDGNTGNGVCPLARGGESA